MKDQKKIYYTVAVVTYNSSKTILETLESVSRQTYKNIELIISDDCSKDNTLAICEEWVHKNKDKFARTKILVSKENTGISPNRNRCVREASGEWIKFVDGDDMLTPSSIESYVNRIEDDIHCIMGKYYILKNQQDKTESTIDCDLLNSTASEQLMRQEQKMFISWPGLSFRTETWLALGGMDERFPMLDDSPFIIKVLEAGYKFHGLDEFVFIYRIHAASAQRSMGFHISHVNYVNLVLVPKYKRRKKYIDYWHDKWWSKKELLKIEGKNIRSNFVYLLMLLTDSKEWKYLIRDKVYRPIVFYWRRRL